MIRIYKDRIKIVILLHYILYTKSKELLKLMKINDRWMWNHFIKRIPLMRHVKMHVTKMRSG